MACPGDGFLAWPVSPGDRILARLVYPGDGLLARLVSAAWIAALTKSALELGAGASITHVGGVIPRTLFGALSTSGAASRCFASLPISRDP
jgi:hypothetical protein